MQPERDAPTVIVSAGPHLVGLSARCVRDMFLLGPTSRPPGFTGAAQRGVTNLRGRVLPVFDLRVSLGYTSAAAEVDELVGVLTEREKDHRSWLDELGRCVRDGSAFTLATDPERCKFGRWYRAFRTDSAVLRMQLERFEAPHAEIHALAVSVLAQAGEGDREGAVARVEAARGGVLARLVALFAEARTAVRDEHREIGVVVELRSGEAAVIAVDRAEAVTAVEPFDDDQDPLARCGVGVRLEGLARWRERPQPIFLLAPEALVASA